jgi:hypothetical protein
MKRKLSILSGLLFVLYLASYLVFRQSNTEVWIADGKPYVIFGENKITYYFYRPISILDSAITGIGFHIGPHRS